MHDEIKPLSRVLSQGTKGTDVRRVQEWLTFHGYATMIDGEFGPATAAALMAFGKATIVTQELWLKLSAPLLRADAVKPVPRQSFGTTVERCARSHLAEHPREIGGDNRGPWVRRYCGGHDGPEYPWCQGFASSMWDLAADLLKVEPPFPLTESGVLSLYVPWVVNSARRTGKFKVAAQIRGAVPIGSMAFIPGGPHGYQHVALVVDTPTAETITTIEGNTNQTGSSNGYEVAQRFRRRASCDYGLAA